MPTLSAAVIGTGFMGAVHTEALWRAGVTVAGILGSSAEKSRAAAERWGIPRAYTTFEEALADPEVDAVHLVVPNRLHVGMARAALAAGKHVMCEKPLAMTAAESAELVALARQRPSQVAAVCYNIRFYPLCIEARERIRRGDVGEVFHVCGSYVQDWLLLPTDYNWRVLAEEGGALRAMADIGSHWLDLVQWITGLDVTAVCADLKTVHPERRRPAGEVQTFTGKEQTATATHPIPITTDDYGCVLLSFASGARGSLWVSQVTAGRKNCLRFEVAGSKQALAWNSERPNELWIGHRDAPNQILIRDPSLVGDAARAAIDTPGGHNEGYADTFKQCFRAFYGAIAAGSTNDQRPDHRAERGGAPNDRPSGALAPSPRHPVAPSRLFATFEDGHREIVLGEAILESHRRGVWVTVASPSGMAGSLPAPGRAGGEVKGSSA
jgi:predicted dehydrogenase